MSVYTCIACRVVFTDGETQRTHYKTDWHRYNLKRKVAELPPVSAENFRQRALNAQQTQAEESGGETLVCDVCSKQFRSQNALDNHLNSRKHKEIAAKPKRLNTKKYALKNNEVNKSGSHGDIDVAMATGGQEEEGEDIETDSDMESVSSFGDEEGLGVNQCLFCCHGSSGLEENVQHMTEKHSFFLPDAEYLSDLEGLVTYLGQKVGVGYMCLWCNEKGKAFRSVDAAQKHMVDKGHCKLLHEGDVVLEYADFYDYRSSYPDHEEVAGSDGGEEMEVDIEPDALAADGYELVLPSGATIGHRSLQRYYKQNINPRSVERGRSILPRMLAQYKALGWTGATGSVAERRCKDLAAVQRIKNLSRVKLGQKANKFQPHFRSQIGF
ncbi:cytoplasmic 60S subunit biogenesis factor ZNF622-like isoform X2 [Mya arenaria]|nr:cytoplasmic 60S subunit biogenesis factor ZNF622-like isoform X2 [Mya arenaria]XP_052813043.1 cytoplasmic 60S subunit biogenesis factor ZNF622-like isoform X2 [Mya arenaria]XP_052813052.1 cytoplasmic 60S subunit biogenesis factor ZNF622-like isoform X2 [Mya arenaria]